MAASYCIIKRQTLNCLIITIFWLISSNYQSDGAQIEPDREISMPTFDDASDFLKTAHIMSEIIFTSSYLDTLDQDDNEHHNVNERVFLNEFVCLENGEQHFTISSMSKGKTSYYIEAATDQRIYQYRPYECNWNDLRSANFYPQLWHEQSLIYRATEMPMFMRWFGVSALWEKTKGARSVQQITYVEDVRNQGFVRCIRWSFDDIVPDYKVSFYFEMTDTSNNSELQLRAVILESKQVSLMSITINVLEVSKLFNIRVFNLPLGFGCQRKQSLGEISEIPHNLDKNTNKLKGKFLLDIEITASVEGLPETGNPSKSITTSSTLSVQLARGGASLPSNLTTNDNQNESSPQVMMDQQLQMIRISGLDTHKDSQVKMVWDQSTGVKYTIDYTSDVCKQESFSPSNDDPVVLEFKNYVTLELTEKLWHELFVSTDGYHLTLTTHQVKQQERNKLQTVYFMEKKLDYLPARVTINDKQVDKDSDFAVSLVRKYNVDVSSSYTFLKKHDSNKDEKNQDDIMYGIEQVSMFVYTADRSKILTRIVFQIDYTKLKLEEISRQLFDVTPCFTQEHHNYAWIRLTYPLTTKLANLIKDRQSDIREHFARFVRNYQLARLSPLQLPKIEVTINSIKSELIIRALILDRPSMLIQFQQMPNKILRFDDDKTTFYQLESKQVARDKEHCGQLCKLYKCKLFSFCNNDHSCYLVHNNQQSIKQMDNVVIEDQNECTLFILDETRAKLWIKQQTISLQYILSSLQHDRYDEKLMLDLLNKAQSDHDNDNVDSNEHSGSGSLDDFKYVNTLSRTINKYFVKNSHSLPLATFSMPIELSKMKSVIFMEFIPVKFEIENDPLDDIMEASDDQLSQNWSDELGSLVKEAQSVDFHVSRSERKYWKLGDNKDFKQLSGSVSYDECSLHCIDVGPKCDSFSYCYLRQECIVSLRGLSTQTLPTNKIADDDVTLKMYNCVIVKRNYLNKFIKTSTYNLRMDSIDKLSKKSLLEFKATNDASDCANDCIIHSGTNQQQQTGNKDVCRSFDYCYKLEKKNKYNGYLNSPESVTSKTCYLLGRRQDFGEASERLNETSSRIDATSTTTVSLNEDTIQQQATTETSLGPVIVTTELAPSTKSINDQLTCEHHSRSYLIDFDLYENRGYGGEVNKIDYVQGINVDECSTRCFEDTECRSFRFCFTPTRRPMQSCLMSSAKFQSKDKLASSDNCHLYFLRPSK